MYHSALTEDELQVLVPLFYFVCGIDGLIVLAQARLAGLPFIPLSLLPIS